jgi:ATP-dependent DNA helicase RecG
MSPTELLARQHFARISALLAKENCRVGLLVSSVGCKDKCLEEISQGNTDIVIGTQAVLQKNVEFRRLGLAVVDEQHRFGVIQRFRLFEKGDFPDVLVLSATPIPRTLCQTVYGDMDISVIDETPPGRLPVVTKCFAAANIQEAFGELGRFIRGGNRAYVVCPTIEGDESSSKASAVETHKQLATRVFPDMKVGLLHGGMETEDRERTIAEFRKGGLDILVTTTVIEIGIDVPDAGAILITNGECFGLAQLHQMRGRVGRGGKQGYCLVVAEPQTDAATERLHIFERTNDGFEIAREDLRLRGVGEFFGTRQHGLPELGIGDLFEHGELMRLARKEAVHVVNGQIPLSIEEREALASEVARTYGEKFRLGFV